MAGYQGELDDIYIRQGELEARTGIQHRDLIALKIKKENGGYPLYAIISSLYAQYKAIRKLTGKPQDGELDSDMARLSIAKQKEDVLSRQIKNQLLLGDLILKAEAQSRILALLSTYRSILEKFIHQLSTEEFPEGSRKKVEFMTKWFNTMATRFSEDAMELKEWEVDGSARLLNTRILDLRDKDSQEETVQEYLETFTAPTKEEIKNDFSRGQDE